MAKGCLVAVLAALVGILGLGQGAEAGVTYDFVFRSTDIDGTPIVGGSVVGGGKTFSFDSRDTIGANLVLDVLIRTTDPLFAAGVSVVFDDSNGLAVASAFKWFGQGVAFNMMGDPIEKFFAWRGLACEDTLPVSGAAGCQPFGGAILPSGPPSLPAGTYHIGTVIWDTSSLDGASVVMTEIIVGLNATGAVIDGEKRDITGTEVTKQGFINIIPEPATAGLMGLGLVGLGLVGLRRRAR